MKNESLKVVNSIISDVKGMMQKGEIPFTVTNFSELHDYCDANVLGTMGTYFEEFNAAKNLDEFNEIQTVVDLYLKSVTHEMWVKRNFRTFKAMATWLNYRFIQEKLNVCAKYIEADDFFEDSKIHFENSNHGEIAEIFLQYGQLDGHVSIMKWQFNTNQNTTFFLSAHEGWLKQDFWQLIQQTVQTIKTIKSITL